MVSASYLVAHINSVVIYVDSGDDRDHFIVQLNVATGELGVKLLRFSTLGAFFFAAAVLLGCCRWREMTQGPTQAGVVGR